MPQKPRKILARHDAHISHDEYVEHRREIIKMLWVTLAFILGMGTIGYVVTRFPELLTNDNLALVDGVAVSVPSDRKPGELQIYRCRITKEHIMEPNSNRVATTVQKTVCGFEALDGP